MKVRFEWMRLAGERGSVLPLVTFLVSAALLLIYVLAVAAELTALRLDANHHAQQLAVQAAAVAMRGLVPCAEIIPPDPFALQRCTDSGSEIEVSITRAAGIFDLTIGGQGHVGYGVNAALPLP